jgi:hypothetical protein
VAEKSDREIQGGAVAGEPMVENARRLIVEYLR